MKRKISAILASDIAGYSKLVAENEEETVRRLTSYQKAFAALVTSHEGRVVNTAGDAVLAEFPSSVEAVRCAVEIHEAVRAANLAYPNRAMLVRIGINLGDIVECDDGELLGDGVNIAARLEQVALPGTICVSRTVYEQTENKVSLPFEDIGLQQVKNIPTPIHAYIVRPFQRKGAARGASGLRRWSGWQWRPRIGIAAGFAIAVISVAVGQQLIGRRVQEGTSPNADPVVTPVSIKPLELLNETRLRELATTQNISLPPSLKISPPSPSASSNVTKYLGAWGGDGRWSRGGRAAILVVESVSSSGTALGVYAHSPPTRQQNAPPQRPGQFTTFVGSITGEGLSFSWGQAKYRFTLAPDDRLWGLWQTAGPQGPPADLSITLDRVR